MEDGGPPTTDLVSAAQGGDRHALEGLFARYLPRVRRIVALRLGYRLRDLATYEDLVQEALLHVFENLEKYEKQSEARFRHWLAVCVANSIRSHLRAAGARKRSATLICFPFDREEVLDSVLADDAQSPPNVAQGAELAERIEEALLDMREKQREVIILSRLCGMSPAEVRKEMGLASAAAVRQALSRALRRLEQRIRE